MAEPSKHENTVIRCLRERWFIEEIEGLIGSIEATTTGKGLPMRLFLDCEFNGFRGELISMALVSDEGHEWYEALRCETPVPWVEENAIPIVGKLPISARALTSSLFMFLFQFDSIHVVADWPEDISHFCDALITGPGQRISTPPLTMEVVRVDSQSDLPHNALADARGIKTSIMAKEGK